MAKLVASPATHAWDISSVSEPGAFDFYRQAIGDLYEVADVSRADAAGFANTTSITLFESGAIGRGRSGPQTLRRPAPLIRRSSIDSITLFLNLSNLSGDCDGRDVRSGPGTIHFRDFSRPSASRIDQVDVINLTVSRAQAPDWMLDGHIHGMVMPAGHAVSCLLASHLTTLAEVAPGLTYEEGDAAIEAALLIAGRSVGRFARPTVDQTEAVYRTVRIRATQAIERRLLDPTLTPHEIAAATGASRSTLYRAFADYGGVQRRVQALRLDRARDVLRRRTGRHPTISEVAYQHGFASEAHFSRAFRGRFGHSPSEAAGAPVTGPAANSSRRPSYRYDVWLDWLGRSRTG
jgi:AraC-like DNA-binding protein